MNKSFLLFVVILLFASISYGQTRISLFAGYGLSQFDEETFGSWKLDQTGYLPVGASVEFGANMYTFGLEAIYSVLPFNFDLNAGGTDKVGEVEISQLILGGFVKVRFQDSRDINPYIRVGVGYFGGKAKAIFNQNFPEAEDNETDLKAAIGFNGGIGLDFPFSKNSNIFIEANYYFVERKADVEGAASFRANSFAFLLGYTYIL